MAACEWVQISKTMWRCAKCGRTVAVPSDASTPPRFDAAPPCGWQPRRVLSRGHAWHELWGKTPTTYVCSRCGRRSEHYDAEPECAPKRNVITAAGRYTTAVARWAAAGFPERSDEEVQQLFAICQQCEFFNGQLCRLCGCRCNIHGAAIVNKLRMATESCPANPPRWTASVKTQ